MTLSGGSFVQPGLCLISTPFDILIRISQAPIPDALANEDVARLSAGGTLVGAESLSVGDEDELDQPAMDTP